MNEPETTFGLRDYSQDGEQDVILRYAPTIGRFLEVGGFDAEEFSNVRALYERGWGGLIVEPHPGHADRLRRHYFGSLAVQVLEVAVKPRSWPAEHGQLWTTDDAVSTLDAATLAKWREEVPYDPEPVEVPLFDLAELWESRGPFQFVSIDAEGWSVQILADLLEACRPLPQVVCVEYDEALGDVRRAVKAAGYRIRFQNGTNLIAALLP